MIFWSQTGWDEYLEQIIFIEQICQDVRLLDEDDGIVTGENDDDHVIFSRKRDARDISHPEETQQRDAAFRQQQIDRKNAQRLQKALTGNS